jgi:hypothetical protein
VCDTLAKGHRRSASVDTEVSVDAARVVITRNPREAYDVEVGSWGQTSISWDIVFQ